MSRRAPTDFPYGPLTADVTLSQGAAMALTIHSANLGGIDFTGGLRQSASGPFVGRLAARGQGVDGVVRLGAQGRWQEALVNVRARDTVLAAVDMLTDEADEAGIDACPEFYRNDYISMYLKTQGLGERVKVGGAEALRFSVVSTDCSCGDDEKGDFETLGEAMRAAKRLVDVEGYDGAAVFDRKQEAWCAGCNIYPSSRLVRNAVTHPFWTITCEAEKRDLAQRAAVLEREQAADRARAAAARTARPEGAHFRAGHAQ